MRVDALHPPLLCVVAGALPRAALSVFTAAAIAFIVNRTVARWVGEARAALALAAGLAAGICLHLCWNLLITGGMKGAPHGSR